MDGNKRKVIKSKSSNTALVKKVERHNKKSKSNAQFEPQIVKKRGVYVENKPVKMSLSQVDPQGQDIIKEKKSAPPPRVGRKRFLNSVLTILSKSSTGTQYPDKNDPRPKLKKKMSDYKKPASIKKTEEKQEMRQLSPERNKTKIEPEKKRKKFRSKVLNNNRDYADKFEVIKRTKETRFSSIDSSSKEDIKWSDFPKLVKDNDDEQSNIVNNIVKEISEGQKITESKLKVDKDPSTLVAEAHKNDKKLYNFFVDLLESTFTLYDVKDTRDRTIKSVSSSKVTFEIDEQVAQKLKVNKPPMFDDVTQKPSRHSRNIRSDHEWNDDRIVDYFTDTSYYPMSPQSRQRSKSPVRRKKIKSVSFPHPRHRQAKFSSPSAQSTIVQQKPTNKKPKKNDLLNILREELARDPSIYEEPKNLYDALKVMARNKRKCKKTLRFENVKKNTADSKNDCTLKRRKVMRPSSSFQYKKRLNQKSSDQKIPKSKIAETPDQENDLSVHSIKVYGFEYNPLPSKLRSSRRRKRELSLPYHSSTSECEDCGF